MKFAKMFALLSVLVMIAVPFIVFAENDGSNAETVPTKTLEELATENNYWAKVSKTEDPDGNIIYHISNNTSGNDTCIVNCDECTVSIEGNTGNTFTIPKKCGMFSENGTFSAENIEIVVEGYFNSNSSISMKKTNLTVDGGVIRMTNVLIDMDSSVQAFECGQLEVLTLLIDKGEGPMELLNITMINTGMDKNDGAKISFDNEGTLVLSGTFMSITDYEKYTFGININEICEKAILKDVKLANLELSASNENFMFIIDEKDGKLVTVNTNAMISLHGMGELKDKFLSANGQVLLIAKVSFGHGMTFTSDFIGLFDKEKCISSFNCYIELLGKDGIKEIKSNSLDDSYLFFNRGMSCDLTNITVECESGYSFEGWYTIDKNGVEQKITNPEQFTPIDSTTVYAKASENQSDNNWFYTTVIVMLAIIAIVTIAGLVYFLLRDRGIIY